MKSPKQIVTAWLDRPQVANREALTVGVVGGLVTFALIWLAGHALDAADAIDFGDTIKLWLAALAAGTMLALGLLLGARRGRQVEVLRTKIAGLELREDHELARLDERHAERQEEISAQNEGVGFEVLTLDDFRREEVGRDLDIRHLVQPNEHLVRRRQVKNVTPPIRRSYRRGL